MTMISIFQTMKSRISVAYFVLVLMCISIRQDLFVAAIDSGRIDPQTSDSDMSSAERGQVNNDENRMLRGRIVGGKLVPNATLYPSFAWNGCGGTLIYEDIVLTAAHCQGWFLSGVYVGGIKRDSDGEFRAVDFEVPHPKYTSSRYSNDVMIVRLNSPSTAPIQEINWNVNEPIVNDPVITIGYGATSEGGYYYGKLREVTVNNIDMVQCKRQYRGTGMEILSETMICGGVKKGGKDSCQGDSGGPLYDKNTKQIGIVSFGQGCARAKYPGVYTRLSHYKDFVESMICEHSNNPPSNCT